MSFYIPGLISTEEVIGLEAINLVTKYLIKLTICTHHTRCSVLYSYILYLLIPFESIFCNIEKRSPVIYHIESVVTKYNNGLSYEVRSLTF